MQTERHEELRGYQCGYEDGKQGWRAYNDTYVDVTGLIIVWRLNCSRFAQAYAQGFADATENSCHRLKRGKVRAVLASIWGW